jgi:Mlc titration factor MtfA (ptsG expression regulator)
MNPFIIFIVASCLVFLVFRFFLKREIHKKPSLGNWILPKSPFSVEWRNILSEKVFFYNGLDENDKMQFESRIQRFLLNHKVTGVNTEVSQTDKLLVAASAIIPIFRFKDWKYSNLKEVLLYPNMFNHNFETDGKDRNLLGMVGTGFMEGTMILSIPSLHLGFSNESDKKNTAIHEFVHLIDKMDGEIDGVPNSLLSKQYVIPWLDLMNQKIDEVYNHKTDINPYGGTNRAEFFAVTSEYFFERPKLLKQKHPKLYELLEDIFNTNMSAADLSQRREEIGRNNPCPCGSGKKFKRCCGV